MQVNIVQSLSKRVKNSLAAIHSEIQLEARLLRGQDTETKRVIYGNLSRLQRERRKLEAIQADLKKELKIHILEYRAVRVLAKAGICNMICVAESGIETVV